MNNTGWIKLYRSFLDWEWYEDKNVVIVFLHCLLKANFIDKKWRGQIIKRGSFITSYQSLATELSSRYNKFSIMQVRTALYKLQHTKEITNTTTRKYTVITVNNYDKYQEDNTQDNKQTTNKQQTNNKQITTTKEYKNIRMKEKNNNSQTEECREFLNWYNKKTGKKYQITNDRVQKLAVRRKKYSMVDIKNATTALLKSPFHIGQDPKNNQSGKFYATPDFILRNDNKVDEWLNEYVPYRDGGEDELLEFAKKQKIQINN